MLKLTKANLTAHLCGRAGRFALDCLCLTKHGVISSDGSVLLLSQYPEGAERPEQPILVHQIDAKHASNLGGDEIELEADGSDLTFSSGERRMTARQFQSIYPDVDELVPDYKGAHKVSFRLKPLIKALKALDKAGCTEHVTMQFIDGEQAASFIVGGAGALVMPTQTEVFDDGCFEGMQAGMKAATPSAACAQAVAA